MILCASGLRIGWGAGDPQALIRLAADAGFDGLAIDAHCTRGLVAPLGAAALSAGLILPVMAAPLPEGPLGPGRRLPHLMSLDDDDERRAAVGLFSAALELAVPLGIRRFTVHLGAVPLAIPAVEMGYRFARAQLLDEDEPAARRWAAALEERRALSGPVLDACRHSLDRILPHAERRDATLSLEIAGDPWSAPTPREALHLLAEYRGGPLGIVWDAARVQVLANLGLAAGEGRAAALAADATVWRASEAVGVEVGYLPGLGDPPSGDAHGAAVAPPAGVPIVVSGRTDSTAAEVASARARVAASRSAAT